MEIENPRSQSMVRVAPHSAFLNLIRIIGWKIMYVFKSVFIM